MWWLWLLLGVLLALMVANQVALMRSTAGLKGSRAASVVRVVNIVLVVVAVGLAVWYSVGVLSGSR